MCLLIAAQCLSYRKSINRDDRIVLGLSSSFRVARRQASSAAMFPRRGDCWAAIAVLLLTVANAGNSINVSASGTLDNSDTEALPRGMQSHLRSELIINANSVDDLYSGLNLAVQGGYPRVAFQLPPAMLLLSEPLHINITAVFQGAGADPDGSPLSTLSCSTPDRSLIVFGGPALTVVGVALSGCSAPGLILVKGSSAAVTIIDSSFTNFTRTLVSDVCNERTTGGRPGDANYTTYRQLL